MTQRNYAQKSSFLITAKLWKKDGERTILLFQPTCECTVWNYRTRLATLMAANRPVPTGGRTSDVNWSLSASRKQCSSAAFHDWWSCFGARWKTYLQGRFPAPVTTIDFVSPSRRPHKIQNYVSYITQIMYVLMASTSLLNTYLCLQFRYSQ